MIEHSCAETPERIAREFNMTAKDELKKPARNVSWTGRIRTGTAGTTDTLEIRRGTPPIAVRERSETGLGKPDRTGKVQWTTWNAIVKTWR